MRLAKKQDVITFPGMSGKDRHRNRRVFRAAGKTYGFGMPIKGSHHIFRKAGVEEKINLQKDGNKAKPYQVRQVRNMILKYKIGDKR